VIAIQSNKSELPTVTITVRGSCQLGGWIYNLDCLIGVIPVFVCPVCGYVGLVNKLYKMHGTYIKIVQ